MYLNYVNNFRGIAILFVIATHVNPLFVETGIVFSVL